MIRYEVLLVTTDGAMKTEIIVADWAEEKDGVMKFYMNGGDQRPGATGAFRVLNRNRWLEVKSVPGEEL